MTFRKPLIGGILALGAIIFGFIFLLKGCLAKYDERSAVAPALLFEKNGKKIVFTIVEFEKTISYSRNGGMVQKSVNTNYYIQTNDGNTAEFIADKKIKNHRAIKNFPVETLGASGDNAWVFLGEPMAFDAFTLNKVADIKMLEEKNPSLKGLFPAERQYYSFNRDDKNIYFTAKNGGKWQLNTQTLMATASDYNEKANVFDNSLSAIELLMKQNQADQDSNYQQNSREPAGKYSARQISYEQYQAITKIFYKQRESLDKVRDSLWKMKKDLEENKGKIEDVERHIENLRRTGLSFSEIKTNQDTLNGQWCGLYDKKEFADLYERVSDQRAYDQTARRDLLSSTYSISKNGDAVIDKSSAKNKSTTGFLDGGFLLNKQTARPIRPGSNETFLIVYKDLIGREGKIIITMTGANKNLWTVNTELTEWADWIYKDNMLYVFGKDNKELSSGEVNLLLCINLETGAMTKYDYFKKSVRK